MKTKIAMMREQMTNFLNLRAIDFYTHKYPNEFLEYEVIFKTQLLTALNKIKRTVFSVFKCDLQMKTANVEQFGQMFPHVYKKLQVNSLSKIKKMGYRLDILRNMNAHEYISERDMEFFEYDFSFLRDELYCYKQINLIDKYDCITLGGIIFFVFLFLRDEGIKNICKGDDLFKIIAHAGFWWGEPERFTEKVSKVKLTNLINEKIYFDLRSSLFGNLLSKVNFNGSNFSLKCGNPKFLDYKVSGAIESNKLIVNEYSKTFITYEHDYELTIEDEKQFIETSNMFPSFCLVDLLYKLGITTFNSTTNKLIMDNYESYSKLNHPKFYDNKNIDILLLPKDNSDFRKTAEAFNTVISYTCLHLEKLIYEYKKIDPLTEFSSIGIALESLNCPNNLINDVKYVRNFTSHGYILNESIVYNDESQKYTIAFVVDTFRRLGNFFKEYEPAIYAKYKEIIRDKFINIHVLAKYQALVNNSRKLIISDFQENINAFIKSYGYIKNAKFDIDELLPLADDKEYYLIRAEIEGFDYPLYFYDKEADNYNINQFVERNNCILVEENNDTPSFIKNIKILKK